eukprot:m51a1_g2477 putative atp-dependent rna helicase eif4a (1223) ;mRNA; f:60481-65440
MAMELRADEHIETNVDVEYIDNFDNMGLPDELLRGIYAYGFERPSAIQARAIKPLMKGRDLIAQAQSGTGKTAAFSIGTLFLIDLRNRQCQALFLGPTRELAVQTYKVVMALGDYMKVTCCACIGGTSVRETVTKIEQGSQVVVGTPGRVYDMLCRRVLRTDSIKVMILDEADEMLSRGFKDQIYDIFQALPQTVQVGLFSATMPPEAIDISERFMKNPVKILVKRDELTLEGIKQFYVAVEREEWKLDTLCDLYETLSIAQSVIFANTRRKVEWVADKMKSKNFVISCTHGELEPAERTAILNEFRSGKSRVLITTDLLARGIDVQQVSLVINYDLPTNPENYIHRIGRSARFGRKGVAINFVTEADVALLRELERIAPSPAPKKAAATAAAGDKAPAKKEAKEAKGAKEAPAKKKAAAGEAKAAAPAAKSGGEAKKAPAKKGSGSAGKEKKKAAPKEAKAAEGAAPKKKAAGKKGKAAEEKKEETQAEEEEQFEDDFEEEEYEDDFDEEEEEDDEEEEEEEEDEQPPPPPKKAAAAAEAPAPAAAEAKPAPQPQPQQAEKREEAAPRLAAPSNTPQLSKTPEPDQEANAAAIATASENLRLKTKAKRAEERAKRGPVLPTRKVVDLEESRNMSEAEKRLRRGAELLKMVTLDAGTYELADIPPMSQYELYMSKFGRSNAAQTSSQTHDDDRDIDIGTDTVEVFTRGVQVPDLGRGGKEDEAIRTDPEERVNQLMSEISLAMSSTRLIKCELIARLLGGSLAMAHTPHRFLRTAAPAVEALLDRNTEGNTNKLTFASNMKWSSSFKRFSPPSFLHNRSVVDLCFPSGASAVQTNFAVAYGGVHGEGFMKDRGFVAIWQVQDPEKPLHIMSAEATMSCVCFASQEAQHLVVAGTTEGAVVLWDLRELVSLHTSVKLGNHSFIVRRATYSTDLMRKENHCAAISRITPIDVDDGSVDSREDTGRGAYKIATLDEHSVVNIWMTLQLSQTSSTTVDSDQGLAPGGVVKLIRIAAVSQGLASPFVLRTNDFFFHTKDPNQYFLATDTGEVRRGVRFGDPLYPRAFLTDESFSEGDIGATPVTCVCPSPHSATHFLAGYADGSIRLFDTNVTTAVCAWGGFTKAAVARICWSPTRQCSFFALDASSSLFVFDLMLRATEPALKEAFGKPGERVAAIAVSGAGSAQPSVALGFQSGTVDLYVLVKQLATPAAGNDEAEMFQMLCKRF